MKVVILAGGYGTRLSEVTEVVPKPMVEIGGRPILWHIMKIYSHYGMNEFVILLGYKGHIIKEYFADYFLHHSDITFDLKNNGMHIHDNHSENWKVTLVDTGSDTMTGGRVKRAQSYIGDQTFCLTYGDGVANINVDRLIAHHQNEKKLLTVMAIQPDARFGNLDINNHNHVERFLEKPKSESGWINGGFFICEPGVFDYLSEDESCVFEQAPLQEITREGELTAFRHEGFWSCMDTLRDCKKLNQMWRENIADWKLW